jgi:hypothetical protein
MMKKENKDSVLDLALSTDGPADAERAAAVEEGLAGIDESISERLREAGLTPEQVELVYSLASEVLKPAVARIAEHYRAERELERLEEYFGGEERFDEISRQLLSWGGNNMPADVFESLSTTCQGVIAMYNMMQSSEPMVANIAGAVPGALSEAKLRDMMRDPRYWRDNDRDFIKSVGDGFKKLYDRRA